MSRTGHNAHVKHPAHATVMRAEAGVWKPASAHAEGEASVIGAPRWIGAVAHARVAMSEQPRWFRTCMARALAGLDNGEEPATAPWTPADPVETAAQIEALAGVRRVNTSRRDPK